MTPNEVLIAGSVVFLAGGLFVYWGSRVLTLVRGSEEELNEMLDRDLDVGRQIWWHVRSPISPPQSFLLP